MNKESDINDNWIHHNNLIKRSFQYIQLFIKQIMADFNEINKQDKVDIFLSLGKGIVGATSKVGSLAYQ